MAKVINKVTGEILELETDTPEQLVEAWRTAQELEKMSKDLKGQLKGKLDNLLDEQGRSDVIGNFIFKKSLVQRQTYDKAVIRNVLGEDELDLFTVVRKSAVDDYIKEHREELGDTIYEIKSGLIPDGNAFEVVKLERIAE